MPQALTSPISFFRATPPPESFPLSDGASPDDTAVPARCLGPSLIALIELLNPYDGTCWFIVVSVGVCVSVSGQ